ncbi:M48 family metallopeptidase [Streptomyces sp. TLI_105]|uniref:M48 family metallopeptidase n=1 Tax=Streptomyces sp. TLI_105 TaxID=1881019 RepID=UPI00089A5B1A|nr:M48 family metallopeptidase [Streptomyces sp. TLI_105]SEC63263.1 Zn-dependent protease with chaperone function [Streptomyces sp. TLI_105]
MGATLRAVRALVLLSGFYLLGLGLLALLGAADWVAVLWAPAATRIKILVVSVLLAIPVVRGMAMLRTPRDEEPGGLLVTEADEPRLWATVRELAREVGTRAPDEIRLTADVNAAVTEDARLLGLVGGVRRLYLGLPLAAGLDEAGLRAVLAHELGHYVNADTRLAAIGARGRVQVGRMIELFHAKADAKVDKERARQERRSEKRISRGRKAKEIDTDGAGVTYRTMAKIYTAYGRLYLRSTTSGARRQELAADLAAARLAGRDATARALRTIPAIDAANDFYLSSYAALGTEFGLLPARGEVFGGVRHLLAARAEELAGLREELPDEPASPYDSHPPTAERVARVEALPDDGRGAEGSGPALGLLASPDAALAAIEDVSLTPETRRMRRLDWPDLVHEAMSARVARGTEELRAAAGAATGAAGTVELPALLDAIDAGSAWEIADRLPKSEEAAAATGRAAREFARPALRQGLSAMVTDELLRSGRARWELSWTGPATLTLPDGTADALSAALDAATADLPDTGPLRALLSRPTPLPH